MKKSIYFASILLVTIFTACKKDKEDNTDTTTDPTPQPVAMIEIHEPAEGTVFELGDTVHVDVHITADFDMHGYEAYLINLTANDTVWSTDLHDHGQSYEIHHEWENVVTDHSDMKLRVIAEIDHDGNTTEKEVNFHCHPM